MFNHCNQSRLFDFYEVFCFFWCFQFVMRCFLEIFYFEENLCSEGCPPYLGKEKCPLFSILRDLKIFHVPHCFSLLLKSLVSVGALSGVGAKRKTEKSRLLGFAFAPFFSEDLFGLSPHNNKRKKSFRMSVVRCPLSICSQHWWSNWLVLKQCCIFQDYWRMVLSQRRRCVYLCVCSSV